MSRIGKQPINLPSNTTVTQESDVLVIKGSKGELQVSLLEGISISQDEQNVHVNRDNDNARATQGLVRTLLQNAVTGVTTGWKKELELNGVGMRATTNGTELNLSLGFSHPVKYMAPEGITFTVTKNVICITGNDKQLVGEVAAQIRKFRKPEPYKGKGIRYSNEYVRRKAGKAGKAAK